MENKFSFLQACPLFGGMGAGEIPGTLERMGAETVRRKAGGVFVETGDSPRHVWIVVSGAVVVEEDDWWGNRNLLARIGPGGMFGEAFAFAGVAKMPVRVVAAEKTEALAIRAGEFTKQQAMCPQLTANMLRLLAGKNVDFVAKIGHITKRRTREKLLSYLSSEAARAGKGEFEIPFDRRGLADYLAVDFTGLSAVISKLRKNRVIECRKNRFKIILTN